MSNRKIILASDAGPSSKGFRYAVELCRKMKADLAFLNVVQPSRKHTYWLRVQRRLERELLQDAQVAVGRLLPEAREAGVACEVQVKSGSLEEELLSYAANTPGVAMVLLDAPEQVDLLSEVYAISRGLAERVSAALPCPVVHMIGSPAFAPAQAAWR
jgi:nucleotide-binding universal stress UspA family protein